MKRLFLSIGLILSLCTPSLAQISVDAFSTPDDVTIEHLETFRTTVVDAINNSDGALLQNGTVSAAKLDANANPENRWNEAFNDFVYTGLTIPTSASLTTTTATGTAYINGTRVVKDATGKTYTASKDTYVDLSDNGTYTYTEVANDGTAPATAADSVRLARVSTDTSTVQYVEDLRVTTITLASGSAVSIFDADADTGIQVQESSDEDIIRFDVGNSTLSSAQEILTIQAADASSAKFEPTTDNFVDLGSSSKEFKDLYIDGTAQIDSLSSDNTVLSTLQFSSGSQVTTILDEDTLSSDSATALATQQSIKAYVDSSIDLAVFFDVNDSGNTWTSPSTISETCFITMCGGGGGGAGSNQPSSRGGGGGGAGGFFYRQPINLTASTGYTITVGAKGSGGAADTSGTSGGNTSFTDDNMTLTANGGSGGTNPTGGSGGTVTQSELGSATGGNASGGTGGAGGLMHEFDTDHNGTGASGGDSATNDGGGGGAGSMFGQGGTGADLGVDNDTAGIGFCSGGGGGPDDVNVSGSDGADGFILIECATPGTTS